MNNLEIRQYHPSDEKVVIDLWLQCHLVAPEHRRKRISAKMMDIVEEKLKELGCPKINPQIRTTNPEVIKCYESIGFKVDQILSMGKRLEKDPEYHVEQI